MTSWGWGVLTVFNCLAVVCAVLALVSLLHSAAHQTLLCPGCTAATLILHEGKCAASSYECAVGSVLCAVCSV